MKLFTHNLTLGMLLINLLLVIERVACYDEETTMQLSGLSLLVSMDDSSDNNMVAKNNVEEKSYVDKFQSTRKIPGNNNKARGMQSVSLSPEKHLMPSEETTPQTSHTKEDLASILDCINISDGAVKSNSQKKMEKGAGLAMSSSDGLFDNSDKKYFDDSKKLHSKPQIHKKAMQINEKLSQDNPLKRMSEWKHSQQGSNKQKDCDKVDTIQNMVSEEQGLKTCCEKEERRGPTFGGEPSTSDYTAAPNLESKTIPGSADNKMKKDATNTYLSRIMNTLQVSEHVFKDIPTTFGSLKKKDIPSDYEKLLFALFLDVACFNKYFIDHFKDVKSQLRISNSTLSNCAHNFPMEMEKLCLTDIINVLNDIPTTFTCAWKHFDPVTPFICIAKNFMLETKLFPTFPFTFIFLVESVVSEKFIKFLYNTENGPPSEKWRHKDIVSPIIPMSYITMKDNFAEFDYGDKVLYFPEYLYVYNDGYPSNKFSLPYEMIGYKMFRYYLVSFIMVVNNRYECYKLDPSGSTDSFYKSPVDPYSRTNETYQKESALVLMVFHHFRE